MGLRDKILDAKDLASEDVEVKEWGVVVRVVELDAAARIAAEEENAAIQEALGDKKEGSLPRALRWLVRALRDPENGEPIFAAADLEALGRKNAAVLLRLFSRAIEISAAGDKDIERMAGGSGADPSGATPSV